MNSVNRVAYPEIYLRTRRSGAPANHRCSTTTWSDVIDFAAGTGNTSIVTFFSDPDIPSYCAAGSFMLMSMPTYPGSPHMTVTQVPCMNPLSANAQGIPEIGPEGANLGVYAAGNITYTFVSDVPEPGGWLLISGGCAVLLAFGRWRRRTI